MVGPCAARVSSDVAHVHTGTHRQLHSDDKVIFAGYQMPHPLVNEMKIKARATSWPLSPCPRALV
jgi:hypothetical protein